MTPEAKAFALAALEEALTLLHPRTGCPCARCAQERADKARLAIKEAIEQVEGKAAP